MFKKMFSVVALFLVSTMLWSQRSITVEAKSYDVSDNLDLEAVAIAFGKAKNLEEFEKMINDPQNPISNLDLNRDGYVDFLRVVEVVERGEHLILLQAVLDKDIYQDVATIIVEGKTNNNVKVTIVGDEYIYGRNYVIQPVYVIQPPIYTYFWSPYYRVYYSTYYWNYYPSWYYHYYCMGHHTYHRYMHDWHHHHHHHCSDFHRPKDYHHDFHSYNTYNHTRRNDYGVRYPERGNVNYDNNHSINNGSSNSTPNTGSENGRRQPGSLSTSPNNNRNLNNIPRSVSMKDGEAPVVNRPSGNNSSNRNVGTSSINAGRNSNISTSSNRNTTSVQRDNSNSTSRTSTTLPARPVTGREVNSSNSFNRSSSTTVSRPSSSSTSRGSSTSVSRPSSSSTSRSSSTSVSRPSSSSTSRSSSTSVSRPSSSSTSRSSSTSVRR